ncbi:amidinotransferase domain-containing protein [Ditylenchus destructor]|uniref:Amidinotransferase domain-containing protein n=1 Tax=Ditylenchus destructor TaxID=166010 RepID=A0AAD4N5U0_9BILA|nr:amidinotransferase domain-containing protein [Ditylenchus destructor]
MAAQRVASVAKSIIEAPKILMCRPTHFQLSYAINPWMRSSSGVDKEKAMKQWENLKKTIEKAGAQVLVMEPEGADQYPDLVFTANAAVVRGKRAYISNFFYPERKGEQYFYNKWFKDQGYSTFINTEIPFEGAGDALWVGRGKSKLFCGIGPRTDVRALQVVAEELADGRDQFKVYGLRLIDPRFYHIDTCFCPLNEELALYYPNAFDAISRYNASNDVELIPVSEEDACKFACNAVVIGNTVIMHEGPEKTARDLERAGFKTEFVNMSEFLKSGGSAKCCTLTL